ncbi:MAG: 2-oxoglutarate dehydrogenase complex dihydrolipoyllysine-residue succinyltransferase [Bacteroidota bacterium]|jgi:2-oxoglutarate dehydrogenase E2 component (dihydrolipoamide succinyltransferase)|nr:2-oxoglutarate dehydrogenase complex dihydrolipoyllysine-residue succinyltransferase [Bacteroidota bacterium]MCA6444604.1 2-oxoglutarate dehydrogenase complex dihydrolipoyllysine-residue succinyltransferase [Bacteroidota bacterium]
MSVVELKVPSPGESITEVVIARWVKQTGDVVEKDDVLAEIDSDKATLTLNAEESGKIEVLAAEGDTVKVGQVVVKIDTSVKPEKKAEVKAEAKVETKVETKKVETTTITSTNKNTTYATGTPSVAAAKIMAENNISANQLNGTGKDGRITKQDVLAALSNGLPNVQQTLSNTWKGGRDKDRSKMTSLRKTVAKRLVSVKNETAMLTTFNEIDMSAIYDIRARYKDKFKEVYGTNVGFMSFFTKAVTEALYHFPAVNAMIDGEEIVYNKYCDIGIAVSAPKGLMVPVLRNAELMSLAEIEKGIKDLAIKARDGKLSIPDMEGGTFTITNGGVFGSMMSTPIINPPQSAILGMHNVVERPMAVNGQVVIRPMMYVALSYDHRIIDGRESVGFLVKVKEMLENPNRMIFGGKLPEEVLLGL